MIVNLRGTSGSGKSYIVRKVMEAHGGKDSFTKVMLSGRKQPLAYISTGKESIYIPGHYESPCGGCDTIHSSDEIFALVSEAYRNGHNVLFEGLLVSEEVKRTIALSKEADLTVLMIDLPVAVCLDSINARRRLKNESAAPVNPKNTTNRVRVIRRAMDRLAAAGVVTARGDRDEILRMTMELL